MNDVLISLLLTLNTYLPTELSVTEVYLGPCQKSVLVRSQQ